MRALSYIFGLALLAAGGCAGPEQEELPLVVASAKGQPSKEAAKLISRSIWAVVPETPAHKRDLLSEMIRGSAVAVSGDTLLVSCRVVDGLGRVGITRHNKYRFAQVVAADQGRSVCLLSVPDAPLNVVRGFRWCGDLTAGEPIYAAASRTSAQVSVTEGRVTARNGGGDACALGTDLALPPSTASAILFDATGRVVGLGTGDGGAGRPTAVSVPVAKDAGSPELRLVLSPTELSTLQPEGAGDAALEGTLPPSGEERSAVGSGGEVTAGS